MTRNSKYYRKPSTSAKSFRRQIVGAIAPGASILIVAEGENTEPIYFDIVRNRFAAPTVELEICGHCRGHPKGLTDEALRIRKKRKTEARKNKTKINQLGDFDEIWIVFDADVLTPSQLRQGIDYATRCGVKVAYSEPCFEFWILLHKIYTTALMSKCENVYPRLERAFGWKSYSKEGKCVLDARVHLDTIVNEACVQKAVKNAQQIRTHHKTAGSSFPSNPSTQVDRLITAINEAVSKANKFL